MELVFFLIVILASAIIHEYAHGFVAYQLGDPTAKLAGRLTLNPIPHIDPIGTILVPVLLLFTTGFMVGWAKPVPYNPYNLRNQLYGSAIVSAAGPLSNFLIALIFAGIIRFIPGLPHTFIVFFGIILIANLLLGFFNLVPIPPLDGSKVLFDLLPYSWGNLKLILEQFGFFILLLFIFFLGGGQLVWSLIITSLSVLIGEDSTLIVFRALNP